jgi:penicillin-binding protein 1A
MHEREQRRQLRQVRRNRPRKVMRWRRLLFLGIPVLLLACISMLFGFVMAIASELPPINSFITTKNPANSVIYDRFNHRIALITDDTPYFVKPNQIPLVMTNAIIAIEDKRFYSEPGVDIHGILRAFVDDVTGSGGGLQGASTITEQLVKIMRNANSPGKRTIFEKLTEAALAFQINHSWSPQEVLAEYLNNVYYGEGAYGIEAAAQTYFGHDPNAPNLYGCGDDPSKPRDLCVTNLTAAQAALLAGLVQNPSHYDPAIHPALAKNRRLAVLNDMLAQGYLDNQLYNQAVATPLPSPSSIVSTNEAATNPSYGYFTSWVENQVLQRYGRVRAYQGGLRIHTTLDPVLQQDAQNVVDTYLPPNNGLPSASLVAIQNSTGQVLSMIGGYDYDTVPFNLATQAQRQPGSAWKVFDLATALESGYSPNSIWTSHVWSWPTIGGAPFVIHNDEAQYAGHRSLADALIYSDNTVFAHVGQKVGQLNIAHTAHDFGITTNISTNPAMTIGGLVNGVTPLDMAHAYETIAEDGLVTGSLASTRCAGGGTDPNPYYPDLLLPSDSNTCPGPVGIEQVDDVKGNAIANNSIEHESLYGFTPYIDSEEKAIMHGVVTEGTGLAADVPGVYISGKTGTTTNYADAWFCGFDAQLTVCVWVGYPNGDKSMAKQYNGHPVYGGTYPALIFHAFIVAADNSLRQEQWVIAHHETIDSLMNSAGSNAAAAVSSTPPASDGAASGESPSSSGSNSNSTSSTPTTNTTTPTTTPPTTTKPTSTPGTTIPSGPSTTTQTGPGGGAQAP